MRNAETENHGISVGGRKISNLRYADDTALCTENHTDTCNLLYAIIDRGKEKNMKLNAKKTKVMHIGIGQYENVSIDGVILERVDDFIYLGSCKTKNGDCKIDVDRRIGMAKSRMIDLGNIWKDKDLSISLKLKILKVLVWATVIYGAEGWTLKKEEKKKIQFAEFWFYRILLNVTWHHRRTNQRILDELR